MQVVGRHRDVAFGGDAGEGPQRPPGELEGELGVRNVLPGAFDLGRGAVDVELRSDPAGVALLQIQRPKALEK